MTEGFFFRNPNSGQSIYRLDGGQTLLIGDVLQARGMGSANCPVVRVTDNVPDPAALAHVFADPMPPVFRSWDLSLLYRRFRAPQALAGASPPDLFTGSDRQAGGRRARRWAPPSPPHT